MVDRNKFRIRLLIPGFNVIHGILHHGTSRKQWNLILFVNFFFLIAEITAVLLFVTKQNMAWFAAYALLAYPFYLFLVHTKFR